MTLQGCQILDVAPAEGRLGSSPIEVTPPADAGYPRLSAVPPRPQLSYPVEQRREVVEELISDRENARYTGQAVRYRTGRSDLPPPPRPTSPVETAQAIVQTPQVPVPPTADGPMVIEDDGLSDDTARTLGESEAELDDGSLNDFIRDLVRDTGPSEDEAPILTPVPGTTVAPGTPPPASQPAQQAAPSREAEPQGPVQRFVGWLGGLFRRGEAAAEPEQESARPPARSLPALPLAPARPEMQAPVVPSPPAPRAAAQAAE